MTRLARVMERTWRELTSLEIHVVDGPEDEPGEHKSADVAVEVLESIPEDRDADKVGSQLGPLLVQEPQNDRNYGTYNEAIKLSILVSNGGNEMNSFINIPSVRR